MPTWVVSQEVYYNNIPYMNQCYENYFYDKDNKWEKLLGNLEAKWSILINKIIYEDYYPNENEKNTLMFL